MKFENQYLTYTEYRLLGGSLDIMPFNLLEFESRKIIDGRTQNRLIGIEEIPQEVKLCVNNMVDILNSYISKNRDIDKNVVSETVGSYSVTYLTTGEIQDALKSKRAELEDIMMNYLLNCVVNNEHLMYLGAK